MLTSLMTGSRTLHHKVFFANSQTVQTQQSISTTIPRDSSGNTQVDDEQFEVEKINEEGKRDNN